MVKCSQCKGTGWTAIEAVIKGSLNNTFIRCKFCQGEGQVREVYMDEYWYGKIWDKETAMYFNSLP